MKNIIKILISALLILSMAVLPAAAVENESADTAWMEKLSSCPQGEYESMVDGEVKRLDIWLAHSEWEVDENGKGSYYQANMRFFEKYVPEERRKENVFVSRLTTSINVMGTAEEVEYYCSLDEVKKVTVCGEARIVNNEDAIIVRPITKEEPTIWRLDIFKTVADVKVARGKDVTIKDQKGNVLADNDFVGTGYSVTEDTKTYTLVVIGDVNGDGMVSAIDYLGLGSAVTSSQYLNPVFTLAADLNGDGSVSAADCLAMKTMLRK